MEIKVNLLPFFQGIWEKLFPPKKRKIDIPKCQWCRKGYERKALDEDGVLCSLTHKPEKYQHAVDIYFWECEDGKVNQ